MIEVKDTDPNIDKSAMRCVIKSMSYEAGIDRTEIVFWLQWYKKTGQGLSGLLCSTCIPCRLEMTNARSRLRTSVLPYIGGWGVGRS